MNKKIENGNRVKGKFGQFIENVKKLQGDPHFLAMGMAIGVFVAMTPLIPFHTVLAVAMAYIFKGSKPAAVLGVWASNPFTVIFIYLGCYKIGIFFIGNPHQDAAGIRILVHALEQDIDIYDKFVVFMHFFHTQLKLFIAMIAGGIILGLPAGFVSYFLTKIFVKKIDLQRDKETDKEEIL